MHTAFHNVCLLDVFLLFVNSTSHLSEAKMRAPLWFQHRPSPAQYGQNVAHGNPYFQKSSGYILWRFKRANYWTLNDSRAKNAFVFSFETYLFLKYTISSHVRIQYLFFVYLFTSNEDYQRESERQKERKKEESFSKSFVQMNKIFHIVKMNVICKYAYIFSEVSQVVPLLWHFRWLPQNNLSNWYLWFHGTV